MEQSVISVRLLSKIFASNLFITLRYLFNKEFSLLFFSRVNCSFYFKIGACRHGDRCSRLHNKPTFSQVRTVKEFLCKNRPATVNLLQDMLCNLDSRLMIGSSRNLNIHVSSLSDHMLLCSFFLQTILIQNIYRNPQNSAQTADASRCKLHI